MLSTVFGAPVQGGSADAAPMCGTVCSRRQMHRQAASIVCKAAGGEKLLVAITGAKRSVPAHALCSPDGTLQQSSIHRDAFQRASHPTLHYASPMCAYTLLQRADWCGV